MQAAADAEIFERASREDRVLISSDTDFATLLAMRKKSEPSLILFRRITGRNPAYQSALIIANLPTINEVLERGSVVVIAQGRRKVYNL